MEVMRFSGGLRGPLFILAVISTAFYGMMEFWRRGAVIRGVGGKLLFGLSSGFFLIAIGAGIVFALVQTHRGKTTYRSRLVSSAISLSLAAYFIAEVVYSATVMSPFLLPITVVYLLLAYRLVTTDLRMWRWFGERQGDSSPA